LRGLSTVTKFIDLFGYKEGEGRRDFGACAGTFFVLLSANVMGSTWTREMQTSRSQRRQEQLRRTHIYRFALIQAKYLTRVCSKIISFPQKTKPVLVVQIPNMSTPTANRSHDSERDEMVLIIKKKRRMKEKGRAKKE
jgi:hypothetical protein